MPFESPAAPMPTRLPSPDRFGIAGKVQAPAEHAQLVVVGAGAAGCAAAVAAAQAGAQVLLIDEHPVAPGLIGLDVPYQWGGRATAAVQRPERLVEQVLENNPALALAYELGVDVRLSTMAFGAWVTAPGLRSLPTPLIGLADEAHSWLVSFDRLILATGARDLTLSFEGSEQPGIVGAQAFHALLTRYDAFAGRRLVILGAGSLALDAAELALARGLEVAALVDVAPTVGDATGRLAALARAGVEILAGYVPLLAKGGADGVTGLVVAPVAEPARRREFACDTVVQAIGTVPAIELFDVLGAARTASAERGGHVPVVDADGGTSLPFVYAAGDCAGLGGNAAAAGRAAARAALDSLGLPTADLMAAEPTSTPTAVVQDGAPLAWMRALLATGGPDVLACTCEEVTRGEILGVQPPRYLAWRSNAIARRDLRTLAADGPVNQDQVKRLTRACMGVCQARRCREQVAMLLALGTDSAHEGLVLAGYRAPVRPLPLSTLGDWHEDAEAAAGWDVWFGIATQWIGYDDIGTPTELEQLRTRMDY